MDLTAVDDVMAAAKEKVMDARRIPQAHETIRALMDRIEILSRSDLGILGEQRWKAVFQLDLLHFERETTAHHQAEEQGGYLSDVLARAPHLKQKAHQLLQDHRELVAGLEHIHQQLANEADAARIQQEALNLLGKMREHHAAEEALIQAGLGEGDVSLSKNSEPGS